MKSQLVQLIEQEIDKRLKEAGYFGRFGKASPSSIPANYTLQQNSLRTRHLREQQVPGPPVHQEPQSQPSVAPSVPGASAPPQDPTQQSQEPNSLGMPEDQGLPEEEKDSLESEVDDLIESFGELPEEKIRASLISLLQTDYAKALKLLDRIEELRENQKEKLGDDTDKAGDVDSPLDDPQPENAEGLEDNDPEEDAPNVSDDVSDAVSKFQDEFSREIKMASVINEYLTV